MAASPIVAVRSAVIAGLAALPSLSDVEVSFGWRGGSSARERVYTERARFTEEPAALRSGRNYRNETGLFDLVVWVEGPNQDAETVADRANDLREICEDWISDRKNNELAITGLQSLQVAGDGTADEAFADSGSLAQVRIPVKYTARIT